MLRSDGCFSMMQEQVDRVIRSDVQGETGQLPSHRRGHRLGYLCLTTMYHVSQTGRPCYEGTSATRHFSRPQSSLDNSISRAYSLYISSASNPTEPLQIPYRQNTMPKRSSSLTPSDELSFGTSSDIKPSFHTDADHASRSPGKKQKGSPKKDKGTVKEGKGVHRVRHSRNALWQRGKADDTEVDGR